VAADRGKKCTGAPKEASSHLRLHTCSRARAHTHTHTPVMTVAADKGEEMRGGTRGGTSIKAADGALAATGQTGAFGCWFVSTVVQTFLGVWVGNQCSS
jgi:membrane peptidoglycan carboxypeptidase